MYKLCYSVRYWNVAQNSLHMLIIWLGIIFWHYKFLDRIKGEREKERACGFFLSLSLSQCWYLNGAFFFRPMSFHDKLLTILMPAQYELSESLKDCQLVCEDGICFLCLYCVQLILLRVIKSRNMVWEGYVACMEDMRNARRNWSKSWNDWWKGMDWIHLLQNTDQW